MKMEAVCSCEKLVSTQLYNPKTNIDIFTALRTSNLFYSTTYSHSSILLLQAFGVQTAGGTGALRAGAELLVRYYKYTTFYISAPTWGKLTA
jgi:aspartate/tyrosine/aromatic aminotransferase